MSDKSKFVIEATIAQGFDALLERVPDALKAEGFGVLTEIDIQATLKKKLDVDFRRYRILGACHPPSAHKALSADLNVGALLPCNVLVYEVDDGHSVVAAIDPMAAIADLSDDPTIGEVASDVKARLERVVQSLSNA
jgi:uncharacterized protein (DUF302 family)